MDFKAELVKKLELGAIAEATMLEDYVKACEAIAVKYHESEVKKLHIQNVKARYFRVAFTAKHPKGSANGAVMYVTNGTYLGGAETIEDIKKTNGVTNVAILSITELTEDDYNYYMNH